MRSLVPVGWVFVLVAVGGSASELSGQGPGALRGVGLELLPSIAFPVGAFAEREPGLGARFGTGIGLGASAGVTSRYGGFAAVQYIRFGCDGCAEFGFNSTLVDVGFEAGAEARFAVAAIQPWLRIGLVGHQLQLRDSDGEAGSRLAWGGVAGIGADYPLWRGLALSPAVRFRSYEAVFPLATFADQATSVHYASASVGLRYRF